MTKNSITIFDVANWFLNKESMTHKKLQKLCYYSVAWGWALMDKSIVENPEFQAWVHGPVSRPLYDRYKQYGWNELPVYEGNINIPDDVKELLESVWLTYGNKSGNELEAISHAEKPWNHARSGVEATDNSSTPIDPIVMKDYYNSIKSTEF